MVIWKHLEENEAIEEIPVKIKKSRREKQIEVFSKALSKKAKTASASSL